ncbi:MAG: 4Fe-4S binding protein [Candidatus Cloacimonetes bacterium]|nr:4Fe-4S binding protein [Candidatus Cloacimonadota bacterium]
MNTFLKIREKIQLFFFLISVSLLFMFFYNFLEVIHKLCPYSIICFGTMSIHYGQIVYPVTLIISLILTLSVLWAGRWFCGYICFLGTIQEWIYRTFHKKCLPFLKINKIDEKRLGVLKYLILLLTIVLGFVGLSRIYMNFCPVMAIGWVKNITIPGIITLFIILVGSAFIERFWCRFLCPYAALMNLIIFIGKSFNIKSHQIKRNLETCIDCGICCKACPMNIDLLEEEVIENPNCIKCFRCVQKCPKKGTLK